MEKINKLAKSYDPGRHSGTNLSLKQLTLHPYLIPRDFQAIIYEDFHIKLTIREIESEIIPMFCHKEVENVVDAYKFTKYFLQLYYHQDLKRRKKRIKMYNITYPSPDEEEPLTSFKEKPIIDYNQMTIHTEIDRQIFLKSMRKAFNAFNHDSKCYIDRLQILKGPAIPPFTFRELFDRIFLIRLTFPEIGVIYQLVEDIQFEIDDPESDNGLCSSNIPKIIEGPKFLVWFYKLARLHGNLSKEDKAKRYNMDFFRNNRIINSNRDLKLPDIFSSSNSHPPTTDRKNTNDLIQKQDSSERRKSLVALDYDRISNSTSSDRDFLMKILSGYSVDGDQMLSALNSRRSIKEVTNKTTSDPIMKVADSDLSLASARVGEDDWSKYSISNTDIKLFNSQEIISKEVNTLYANHFHVPRDHQRKIKSATDVEIASKYFPMYASSPTNFLKSRALTAELSNSRHSIPTRSSERKSIRKENFDYMTVSTMKNKQAEKGLFFFPPLVLGLKQIGKQSIQSQMNVSEVNEM